LRWLFGLTAAALIVRVAFLTTKGLWFDETVSVFIASQPIERIMPLLAANDPHPPLHYLLLHAWMALLGDGERAVRSLGVLIGTAAVLAAWLLGRRLFGAAAALVAAGLVIAAPSQVAASQEARMYGLLTLTALLSWWALWNAVTDHRLLRWAAYAVAVTAMLYAHYFGFFVVGGQFIWLLWRRTAPGVWRRWVYAGAGVLLLFLPWAASFIQQLAGGRAWPAHRVPLTPGLLVDTLAAMVVGRPLLDPGGPRITTIEASGSAIAAVIGLAAAAVLMAVALHSRAYPNDAKKMLVCAAAAPLLLALGTSMVLNVFAPRYMLFIGPPLALLVGSGFAAMWADGARRTRWLAAPLVVLVLWPNAAGTLGFYRQPRLDVFDWRMVSQRLSARAQEGDAVVFLPGFSRIPVNYYYRRDRGSQVRLALAPDGEDVIGPGGARLSVIVPRLAQHPRVWIITVPPIPPAVDAIVTALGRRSYIVLDLEHVNLVTLIQMKRLTDP
jgi:4-amino-4-deoxy-L-arabinose transferase-like glycosyltransferase